MVKTFDGFEYVRMHGIVSVYSTHGEANHLPE
jgi:hypothetical protein